MKKILTIVVVLVMTVMVLSMSGCSLFADDSKVKLTDSLTHTDPKGLQYDERIVLKGDGYAELFEGYVNAAAYPNLYLMDDSGTNVIGMYIYDESTGLATGWTSFEDGSTTMYPAGEEIDLGKPDESLMIDIPGTVDLAVVIYGKDGKAINASFYLSLSDASAKEQVLSSAAACMGFEFSEEAEGVLKAVKSDADIQRDFELGESYGFTFESKDAQAYGNCLKNCFGYNLKAENAANPYVPYSGHEDPEDLDYDSVVVLTGAGTSAVPAEAEPHLLCMTDYIYEKDGLVVAHYMYYEFDSKEAAEMLLEPGNVFNGELVSDTVVKASLTGEEMQTVLTQYMGYNVLSGKDIDAYVTMVEGMFGSTVYK